MLTGKLLAMALTAFLQLLYHESELSTILPQTRMIMDYIKLVAFKKDAVAFAGEFAMMSV